MDKKQHHSQSPKIHSFPARDPGADARRTAAELMIELHSVVLGRVRKLPENSHERERELLAQHIAFLAMSLLAQEGLPKEYVERGVREAADIVAELRALRGKVSIQIGGED